MSNLVTTSIGAVRKTTGTLIGALGVVLVIGLCVAGIASWVFTELAEAIQSGATTALDEQVLTWMGAHQSPIATNIMLELTALGTGSVVIMIAVVAGLFLLLTKQRYECALLIVSVGGGLLLNLLLKLHYHRPRPQLFTWDTHAISSSFPSGHAMSSVIVYGTVAYLAARLHDRRWAEFATMLIAAVVIAAICVSRLYLGVHYPSDVAGGVIIGAAWTAFCMAALEGVERLRNRRR